MSISPAAYLQAQWQEIGRDRALQWYGAALAFTVVLSFYFWRFTIPGSLGNTTITLCWPFWPSCHLHPLRQLSVIGAQAYWSLTVGAAFASAAFFAIGRVPAAWWALVVAFLLKAFWHTIDYGYMGNYHYMPYVAAFAFLCLPDKQRTLRVFVVMFYVAAGLLKLNPEWLLGEAMPRKFPWFGQFEYRVLLSYVVVLELVLVFGLLHTSRRVRFATLAQFALFHLMSWFIVGYFYPLVMFCLLTIFVTDPPAPEGTGNAWHVRPASALAIALFGLAQITPKIGSRDPALHGEKRLWALNMFDANAVCETGIYVKRKNETIEIMPDYKARWALRIHCDPIVYRNEALAICRENATDPDFRNVDVILHARRSTGASFEPVLAEENICPGPAKEGS